MFGSPNFEKPLNHLHVVSEFKRYKERKFKYEDDYADTVEEILDYEIDGDKLRDIVTRILVEWRAI